MLRACSPRRRALQTPGNTAISLIGWRTPVPARRFSALTVLALAAALLPARHAVAGAALVRDINTQVVRAASSPRELVQAGGRTYFIAETPAAGVGLWTTDGTAAGTVLVRGFGNSRLERYWLTGLGDAVLFTANDGTSGPELWRSDGTTAGTVAIDLNPGVIGSRPAALARSGRASSSAPTMGTPATSCGSPMVRRPARGWCATSLPRRSVRFPATWWGSATRCSSPPTTAPAVPSCGAATGPRPARGLVRDIADGPDGSFPAFLAVAAGALYFAADDGVSGDELWVSDGSAVGTRAGARHQPGCRRAAGRPRSRRWADGCSSPPTIRRAASSCG